MTAREPFKARRRLRAPYGKPAPQRRHPELGTQTMMFDEAPMNPADLSAIVESAPKKRTKTAGKAGERKARASAQPTTDAPSAPIASDAARARSQPTLEVPHAGEPFPGTNPMYQPAIDLVVEFYRLRQDMIKARTKLILQAQSMLRRRNGGDKDAAAKDFAAASKDEGHPLRPILNFYLVAIEQAREQQDEFEKLMVSNLKGLPILKWARGIKGFGDASLGCIIGECSGYAGKDIYDRGRLHMKNGDFYSVGDFKSVSAVWKRMGLAVLDDHRQGNPGKGASAADWIEEGYSKTRRSVMWNVGNSLILSMGKFRPMFGEDVHTNSDYTELQRVFAARARYEAQRLPHKDGTPIKESATGKDSYTLHAANRAKRYTEKRLLRMLFAEWRRCMA